MWKSFSLFIPFKNINCILSETFEHEEVYKRVVSCCRFGKKTHHNTIGLWDFLEIINLHFSQWTDKGIHYTWTLTIDLKEEKKKEWDLFVQTKLNSGFCENFNFFYTGLVSPVTNLWLCYHFPNTKTSERSPSYEISDSCHRQHLKWMDVIKWILIDLVGITHAH